MAASSLSSEEILAFLILPNLTIIQGNLTYQYSDQIHTKTIYNAVNVRNQELINTGGLAGLSGFTEV